MLISSHRRRTISRRDFVPWRFSDGQPPERVVRSSLPAPENLPAQKHCAVSARLAMRLGCYLATGIDRVDGLPAV
jgi:hypothetical protein